MSKHLENIKFEFFKFSEIDIEKRKISGKNEFQENIVENPCSYFVIWKG